MAENSSESVSYNMVMKLFGKEYVSQLPKMGKFRTPHFIFLAKMHGKGINTLRLQMERWLKNIPNEHQSDIISRIRSRDDKYSYPAFYELMWHQFLLEEGWKAEIHPTIGADPHHPDFKVTTSPGDIFYLEISTVFAQMDRRIQDQRFDNICEAIDQIQHKFMVSLSLKSNIPTECNLKLENKKISKFLINELNNLDPNLDGRIKPVEVKYKSQFIKIDFLIYAMKKPTNHPILWAISGGVYSGNASGQIQKALEQKVKKYKTIKSSGRPLVIAICGSGHPTVDEHALDMALFGNHMVTWNVNAPHNPQTRWSRDQSGLVTPKASFPDSRNTRISAVIFCERYIQKQITEYKVKLFHNPWTKNPLKTEVFSWLPQLVVTTKTSNEVKMDWINNDDNKVVIFR